MKPAQAALDLRDDGIRRAANHAEHQRAGWNELADVLLREFAKDRATFNAAQFAAYARGRGLPNPPDGRAFGGVIMRAKRDKLVAFDGYEPSPDPKHHAGPVTRWRTNLRRF